MRVENKTDREDSPEECDNCGSEADTERFYHYGAGHNVEWLCVYCANAVSITDPIVRAVAGMLNQLEKRLSAAQGGE